mgnify:CR=1 FL=1
MAKSTKKEVQVSLETVLWNCRVALRGIGSTEKNRDAVIGLVFLKFAGDKFEKRRAELIEQYGEIPAFLEKVSFYNAVNVFYLKETARWSYIVKNASANDIAVIIDQAMADIEDSNPPLKGALPLNLFATLGADKSKIKDLIDNVNQISEERFQEEDLIGRVYEYFLQVYAASGTKEDGEFYTPACVVKLIAEMIEPYSGVVYDPCCGSGGMFVQSLKFVDRHDGNRLKVSIIGQESNPDTWRLCKMNLAIRGISHNLGDTNASTFTNDLHKDMTVDYIMANPPFNLKGWRAEDALTDDPRFMRAGYSVMPPVANANYAWILHMLSKLDVNHGVAGFLLANGALNIGDAEGTLRKEILERDRVEAIIVLPRDMFYTTDISVTLWIVNMNKKAGTVNGRQLRDRTHEVLFGDGAGAVLIKAADNMYRQINYTRGDTDVLVCRGIGAQDAYVKMNGNAVFRFAVDVLKQGIDEILKKSDMTLDDIDYIVCHQANERIINHVKKKYPGHEDKFYINIAEYGNTSAASIPIALDELAQSGCFDKGRKLILAGFGAGLSWSSALIET